jgi:hypothetical protein
MAQRMLEVSVDMTVRSRFRKQKGNFHARQINRRFGQQGGFFMGELAFVTIIVQIIGGTA